MGSLAILHAVSAMRSDGEDTVASTAAQLLQSNSLEQLREKQRWKACKWIGFTTYKQYHFQFTVDGRPTAVLLERYKKDPEIRLWDGAAWKLNLYKSELEWQRAEPDGSESHVEPRTFALVNASYVRYVPGSAQEETPSLIMIGQPSGDPLVFSGGTYLNDELMKLSLSNMRRQSQEQRQEGVLAGTGSLVNTPARAGAERVAGNVWSSTKFGVKAGAVVGAGAGAGLAALPLVLVGSAHGAALASAIVTGALQGGAVLGGVGVAMGVATGLLTGLTGGAVKYRKLSRESGLGLPEKIFEKLRCHWQFKACRGDVLVHKGTPCPQWEPGSDFLAKMFAAAAEATAS